MQSPCCLYVCVSPLLTSEFLNQFLMKFGMYIMAHDPILAAYFINPSHQSVCLYVYPLPLLSNGSVKTLLLQRIHTQLENNGPCRIKKIRRLVLPVTSYLFINSQHVSAQICHHHDFLEEVHKLWWMTYKAILQKGNKNKRGIINEKSDHNRANFKPSNNHISYGSSLCNISVLFLKNIGLKYNLYLVSHRNRPNVN
jgi:hypothetical protein